MLGIEPSTVPTWVSLPSLPLNFLKKAFLELLVKPIGKVLAYDQATLSLARLGVTRVCVEVNLLASNLSRIWIDMGKRVQDGKGQSMRETRNSASHARNKAIEKMIVEKRKDLCSMIQKVRIQPLRKL